MEPLGRTPLRLARALWLLWWALTNCDGQPLEFQVKAAFLLNFTRFVEWPAGDGALPGPLEICIVGEDPFGPGLDSTVEGEVVNGRKIAVRRTQTQPPPSCRLLYVSKSEKQVPRLLEKLGPGVLTVGEGEKFLNEGGMIGFVIENRRVRFDVNPSAAKRAELQISSKLLSVARSVAK